MMIHFLLKARTSPISASALASFGDFHGFAEVAEKYESYPNAPKSDKIAYKEISGTGNSDAFYVRTTFNGAVPFMRSPHVRGSWPYSGNDHGFPNAEKSNTGRNVGLSVSGGSASLEFTLAPLAVVVNDTALWHKSAISDMTGRDFFILEYPFSCIRIVAAAGVSWVIAFEELNPTVII